MSDNKVVPFASAVDATIVEKNKEMEKNGDIRQRSKKDGNTLSFEGAAKLKVKAHRIHENVKEQVMKETKRTIELWEFRLRLLGMVVFVVLVGYDLLLCLNTKIIRIETNPDACCSSVCANDANLVTASTTPQLYRNLFRVYAGLEECGSGCINTNTGNDLNENDCDFYLNNTHMCGLLDDEDFSSNDMCCACGGGIASDTSDSSPPYVVLECLRVSLTDIIYTINSQARM